MSPAARLMGRAFPVAIRTAITLPPGPTRGPPRFPGRSSARSVSCTSLRWIRTAGVEGRRFATFGLARRTAGSAGCSADESPKGSGVPSLAARISASPSVASIPTTRTGCVPPVLSMSRKLWLLSTRLASVRKSPCVSIRKAVPKVWSLTMVMTPARSRSSSSGSITPYDTTHLGHAFTYVVFDVLVRVLRAAGQPVRYVQNVTDVDDDIIRRARELGTTWDLLADKETALYVDDMAALNVLAPDVFPRASQTIPKIIALIVRLEAQGHAYERESNVYFRVGSVADYGRLSRLSREQMVPLSAKRGADPNDPRKQDPLDFT